MGLGWLQLLVKPLCAGLGRGARERGPRHTGTRRWRRGCAGPAGKEVENNLQKASAVFSPPGASCYCSGSTSRRGGAQLLAAGSPRCHPAPRGGRGLLLRAGAQRSGSSCVVSCRHAWPRGHPSLAPAPPFSFHPSVSNPSFPPRPPSLHLLPSPGAGGPAGPSKPFTPQLAEGTWAAGNMKTKSLLPFQPILTPLSQSPRYLSPKLCLSKVHGAFHQLLRLSLLLTHTTW